jgi:hypothetical protein
MAQDEQTIERGGIIAFRAEAALIASADVAAAAEGISRSDVARRALMQALRDLQAPGETDHYARRVRP